jgi:hypothetical protein
MAAALLPQAGAISFEAVERETVQRQRRALRLELCASPKRHGAPSPTLAVADMAEIAAILDWRGALELGRPQLLLDVPMRTTISRRIEEGALQRRHRPIDGALTPAWDACEGVLGGRAKSGAIMR